MDDYHHPENPDNRVPVAGSGMPESRQRSGLRELFSTAIVLLSALLVAFILIAYVFQSYEVDGPSMESTLQNHDRLIVWKLPRTWARITGHNYVPQRGDVIIFVESGLATYGQTDTKQLIKRVIGLPGDRVVVNNGTITIYNAAHPDGFQPDKTLPYGKDISLTSGNLDVTLTKDQIFVCGDNRSNSLDSRVFGPVDLHQIVGKLVFRLLPLSHAEKF